MPVLLVLNLEKHMVLPKIHKDGVPLRPIISACNTFSYKLSKLLKKKLEHLRTSPTIVTDTFKFVKELQNLKYKETDVKMVSFDIVSLFTRVPLARTIDLILDKMYGPPHTCIFSQMKRTEWCSNCQQRYELKWLLDISTKRIPFFIQWENLLSIGRDCNGESSGTFICRYLY